MATQKERREKCISTILSKVFLLLTSKSWGDISIDDIERATGFTRGAINYHFGSKVALLQAIIDQYYFNRVSILDVPDERRNSLKDFYSCFCEMYASESNFLKREGCHDIALAMCNLELSGLNHLKGFDKKLAEQYAAEESEWNMMICHAIQSGEIARHNSIIITDTFFKLYLGHTRALSPFGESYNSEKMRRAFDNLYDLLR